MVIIFFVSMVLEKNLSGLLNAEIEILNRPADDYNPFCEFESYANGKK